MPGVPLDKPALMAAIREQDLRSVSAVFAALAPEGAEDAKSKMGLASLLKMMWGDDYVDERDARFINDRVHANIQRDGTFSVVPQMKGGVTTPDQLRRIADVAEKYDVPMVKLTGGQRIDLLGVRKEDLPKVWADLDMPSGYAYGKSFRTVKTCVGQDFCRFGVGDSTALGIDLEARYQGLESPAKIKLAVSGCPRNCAESLRQGRRCRRHRRRPLGDLRRRRRRRAHPQGRPAGHGRRPRPGDDADRPVHAVLPGEREVARAHLRLRAADRASSRSGRSSSTTPRASPRGSTPRCRHPSRVPRSVEGARGTRRRRASSAPRCRWKCCRRCRSDDHGWPSIGRQTGSAPLGPSTRSPSAKVARSRSTARRWRFSGCAPARCGLSPPSARIAAARSPTARSTGRVVVCPLHLHAFELATGCSTTGVGPLTAYPVEVDGPPADRCRRRRITDPLSAEPVARRPQATSPTAPEPWS